VLSKEAEPRHTEVLSRKALDLIKRLAEELEYLVCELERDCNKAPPPRGCFGMAN
jgi:hypothetical protein